MTDNVVYNFLQSTNYSVGVVMSEVKNFTLLNIGYIQGLSMLVLWIKLGCTLDEI